MLRCVVIREAGLTILAPKSHALPRFHGAFDVLATALRWCRHGGQAGIGGVRAMEEVRVVLGDLAGGAAHDHSVILLRATIIQIVLLPESLSLLLLLAQFLLLRSFVAASVIWWPRDFACCRVLWLRHTMLQLLVLEAHACLNNRVLMQLADIAATAH